MLTLEHEIDLSEIIDKLTDRERIKWIRELVESIQEPGTIDFVRSFVARCIFDD